MLGSFEADHSTYWGSENTWLGNDVRYSFGHKGLEGHGVVSGSEKTHDNKHSRHLEAPLAAAHHGKTNAAFTLQRRIESDSNTLKD